ncbi:MAG TPA: hypothetical protein VES89_09085 [Candidatus Competibacteraceae bacterium]|nr:hypothetical protein [Candidatus Competibacteraceae bacterium]
MTDEIIEELWRIKDDIARDYEYNLDALVAYLRSKERAGDHPVTTDLHSARLGRNSEADSTVWERRETEDVGQ